MNQLPPITGTPMDYVPLDAPTETITPNTFTAPVIRRSVVAALAAALLVSGFAFPAFGAGLIAIAALVTTIWGADKLADRIYGGQAVTTTASQWPDPFSWVPVAVALAIILAAIYFI